MYEIINTSKDDLLTLGESFIMAIKHEEPYDEYVNILKKTTYNTLFNQVNNDNKKKAFWINLYNAFTKIKLRDENKRRIYPAFAFFEEADIEVGGMTLSLDDIEHKVLRRSQVKLCMGYCTRWCVPRWESELRLTEQDFRIHFGLNCGAFSCPPVSFYNHEKIDAQLNKATKSFLTSESQYSQQDRVLTTSMIFFWFKGDFGGKTGVINLHKEYNIIPNDHNNASISYREYDWTIALKYD